MDTDKPWHRDRTTLYTLTEHTDRYGRTSQVNDNWFFVQGPDAEAVAERIRIALAAPSAAGGGEIRGGFVEEAVYPALEVVPVAEALLQRLEGRGFESLVPGGEYRLAGTEAHWLELTRAAIGVVRDAFCAVANLSPDPSLTQGSNTGEAGRETGAYGIPGMPDRLRASDQLRIFSAYYADRLPTAACAELVTMADEWDEEARAARSLAPTAPQGADLAGLVHWARIPVDDGTRTLNDSALPSVMIWAGGEAYDDLTADKTLDLDSCALAVGVFRAMTKAAAEFRPQPPSTSAPPASADREPLREIIAEAFHEDRRVDLGVIAWCETVRKSQYLGGRAYAFADKVLSHLALAHSGSVAPTSGEPGPWSWDMAAAPAHEEVEIGAGRMTFLAKLVPNGSLTMGGRPCDQWQATREGEHPPCWSDGCCWASNEDENASLLPDRWRRVAPPPASRTKGERP